MAPLSVGVIVGRFQVPELHGGHRRLLEAVVERSDRVTVLLGVSPMDGYVAENPLTYEQRRRLFDGVVPNLAILPLFDEPTNETWSLQIDRLVAKTWPLETVTLYGGRKSFVEAYTGACRVEILDLRCPDEGRLARAAVKEHTSGDFFRGQIYALQRQYPHAYQTVDIALVRPATNTIQALLIQRSDTGEWTFPGGFVDPQLDASLEHAATRELFEETGLASAGGRSDFKYLASWQMDDWRYRASRDKIVSALFWARYHAGVPRLNPLEVVDYQWTGLYDLASTVGPVHRPWTARLCDAVQCGAVRL